MNTKIPEYKAEVLALFDPDKKSVRKTAEACDLTYMAVYLWPEDKPISKESRLRVELAMRRRGMLQPEIQP